MDTDLDNLYNKYKGIIRSLAKSIVINNKSIVSLEDLQQAGAIGLLVGVKNYDPNSGSFSSYIRRCIRNALIEEANSFNDVFTVDPKLRSIANRAIKMKREGMSDIAIMSNLGISNRRTLDSLFFLVEEESVSIHDIDSDNEICSMQNLIGEIGLTQSEEHLVGLIISNFRMEDIEEQMGLTRPQIYEMKSCIKNKISNWGKLND